MRTTLNGLYGLGAGKQTPSALGSEGEYATVRGRLRAGVVMGLYGSPIGHLRNAAPAVLLPSASALTLPRTTKIAQTV